MPYQIKTKDGITIRNIPDDVAPDSQQLKDRVASIRAGNLAPTAGSAAIPGATPEQLVAVARPAPAQAPTDPSIVDRLVGAGETGLTLLTGATGGALGAIGGLAGGLAGAVASGDLGTQQGVERVGEQARAGMEALTYAPRTQAGQEMAQAVGELSQAALPVIPLTAELGAIGQATRQAGAAAQVPAAAAAQATARAATPAIERIRSAAPAVAERVQRTLNRNPEQRAARGSTGAAATPEELQRQVTAEDLPVPIQLTRGQATREQPQLMFERETAKQEGGVRLRERYAEQNQQILQNFDAWVDQTGAEAPSLRAIGTTVDKALTNKARRDKAEINTRYREAERAGELEEPTALPGLVAHLNESAPDVATAPILNVARQRAIQLGVATEGEGGILVPAETSLKNIERFRQAVGRATDYEATNVRQSAIIKGLVDAETEGLGGNLYKQARRARENYARQYENRAVINKLMTDKRGTSDRQVAFEDVLDHAVIRGSLDDVRHVRRVLQTGGADGQQAWRELQGGTLNWVREQAIKGVATDQAGNPIVSAAGLNKAVRQLDADGKLDFIFGKQGAQQIRDINEIAKLVQTVPPGAINTSNTSASLLAALAEAGTAGALTGIPVPVLSVARAAAKKRQDIKLQKRIDEALARRGRAPTQRNP